MDQVWKGLPNLDPRDPGGFYKKKPLLSVMVINCDGLHWTRGKVAFHATVDHLKPDIIFGCESKLSPDMPTYSIFPNGYNARRKNGDQNGGVVLV